MTWRFTRIVETDKNAGRGSVTTHTQKVCFPLSLLSPLPHSFATKGCAGERKGDSSDITVTATYTWRLGFERKSQGSWHVLSLERLHVACNDVTRYL
jgi:hypothetical protein